MVFLTVGVLTLLFGYFRNGLAASGDIAGTMKNHCPFVRREYVKNE